MKSTNNAAESRLISLLSIWRTRRQHAVRLRCGVLTLVAPAQPCCKRSFVPLHGDVAPSSQAAVCSAGQAQAAVWDGVPALAHHVLRMWEGIKGQVRCPSNLVSCLLQQLLPAGPRGLGGAEQGLYLVIHPWETLSTEPAEKMEQSNPTVVLMWIAYSQRKAEFEARPAVTSAPSLLREQSNYKLLLSSPLPEVLGYCRCIGISEISFLMFCKVYVKIYCTELCFIMVDSL